MIALCFGLSMGVAEANDATARAKCRAILTRNAEAFRYLKTEATIISRGTDTFLKEYAKDTESNRTVEELRKQFTREARLICHEETSGSRALRIVNTLPSSNEEHIIWDGRDDWAVTTIRQGLTKIINARVGGSTKERHRGEAFWRRLLALEDHDGKSMLKSLEDADVLVAELNSGRIVVTKSIAGANWKTQFILELDAASGETRSQRIEGASPANKPYQVMERWDLDEYVQVGRDRLSVPTKFRQVTFNSAGVQTFDAKGTIRIEPQSAPFERLTYHPPLETGANVEDARTGKVIVYGGRASADFLRLMDERIQEAREATARFDEGDSNAPTDSSSGPQFWRWLFLFSGVIALGTVVYLKRTAAL